jgi:hypothetical protein
MPSSKYKTMHKSTTWLLAALLIAALLPFSLVAQDKTAEERGLDIAVEADRRDYGFDDFSAGLTMILRNKHGEETERYMRVRTLEQESDGDKSLIILITQEMLKAPRSCPLPTRKNPMTSGSIYRH